MTMVLTFHLATGMVLLLITIVYILIQSKSVSPSRKRVVGGIIRDMGVVMIIVFTVGFFTTGERYPFMYPLRHPDPVYYGMLVLLFESIAIMILGERQNTSRGLID